MAQVKSNLTKNLKEIEEIVAWFDAQEEVDVEKAIEKVKIGAKLIKESKKRLGTIENEFEEVKKELEE
jgi:exonuclease VII small subunit